MIISYKYRYVFVETPMTGSSAIAKELCLNYNGEKYEKLRKHALYSSFLKVASDEEKNFFVFTSIRNPLDKLVSIYIKIKNNHRDRYTKRLNFYGLRFFYEIRNYLKYTYYNKLGLSFKSFLKFSLPYDDITTINPNVFDFIIRFENIDSDFSNLLKQLNINKKRKLPSYNKTKNKLNFLDYYTDEIKLNAFNKTCVFMKKWHYKYPPDWSFEIKKSHFLYWNILHYFRLISWMLIRSKFSSLEDGILSEASKDNL